MCRHDWDRKLLIANHRAVGVVLSTHRRRRFYGVGRNGKKVEIPKKNNRRVKLARGMNIKCFPHFPHHEKRNEKTDRHSRFSENAAHRRDDTIGTVLIKTRNGVCVVNAGKKTNRIYVLPTSTVTVARDSYVNVGYFLLFEIIERVEKKSVQQIR